MKSNFTTNAYGFAWDNKVVAWRWLSDMSAISRTTSDGKEINTLNIYLGVQDAEGQAHYGVEYPKLEDAMSEMNWLFQRAGEHIT